MSDFVKILVVILAGALISCDDMNAENNVDTWELRSVNTDGLQPVEVRSIESTLLESIRTDYQENPIDVLYAEIDLFESFIDSKLGQRVLIFDIRYVDDTQVVYRTDFSGAILDKFKTSHWE